MDDLIDYQRYLGTNDNATRNYIYNKISEVDPVYHGHKYPQGDLLEVMSNAAKYN